MKQFGYGEVKLARAYSYDGEQALYVIKTNCNHKLYPRYPELGHLFDQNKSRLIFFARRFGVKRVIIKREGSKKQYITLCGKPLERAKKSCQRKQH